MFLCYTSYTGTYINLDMKLYYCWCYIYMQVHVYNAVWIHLLTKYSVLAFVLIFWGFHSSAIIRSCTFIMFIAGTKTQNLAYKIVLCKTRNTQNFFDTCVTTFLCEKNAFCLFFFIKFVPRVVNVYKPLLECHQHKQLKLPQNLKLTILIRWSCRNLEIEDKNRIHENQNLIARGT